MESKYQVTYNKSKYGWFANISYSYPLDKAQNKYYRFRTEKTNGFHSLKDVCELVTKKIFSLEKENS